MYFSCMMPKCVSHGTRLCFSGSSRGVSKTFPWPTLPLTAWGMLSNSSVTSARHHRRRVCTTHDPALCCPPHAPILSPLFQTSSFFSSFAWLYTYTATFCCACRGQDLRFASFRSTAVWVQASFQILETLAFQISLEPSTESLKIRRIFGNL